MKKESFFIVKNQNLWTLHKLSFNHFHREEVELWKMKPNFLLFSPNFLGNQQISSMIIGEKSKLSKAEVKISKWREQNEEIMASKKDPK